MKKCLKFKFRIKIYIGHCLLFDKSLKFYSKKAEKKVFLNPFKCFIKAI